MKILLRWQMPRAYTILRAHRLIEKVGRAVICVVVAVLTVGIISSYYLYSLDPDAAKQVMPILCLTMFPFLIAILFYFLRLLFFSYYTLTLVDLREGSNRLCQWQDVEAYTFEPSEIGHGLKRLKIKLRSHDGFYIWLFNPCKVEQMHIAQIFEQQMFIGS